MKSTCNFSFLEPDYTAPIPRNCPYALRMFFGRGNSDVQLQIQGRTRKIIAANHNVVPERANSRALAVPGGLSSTVRTTVLMVLVNRSDLVERETMLRTKAMREREGQLERRRYRYTLIRIRFPNDIVLQVSSTKLHRFLLPGTTISHCVSRVVCGKGLL